MFVRSVSFNLVECLPTLHEHYVCILATPKPEHELSCLHLSFWYQKNRKHFLGKNLERRDQEYQEKIKLKIM